MLAVRGHGGTAMCEDHKFYNGSMETGVAFVVLLLIIVLGIVGKERSIKEALTAPNPPTACTDLSSADMSELISWITTAVQQSTANGKAIANMAKTMQSRK